MAEWFTVRRKFSGGETTFSAIGYPFAFTWHSAWGSGRKSLRCFPDHSPEVKEPEGSEDFYDLTLYKVGEEDEVFEDGWYLSGIGHHLLWCGKDIPEAVDAAQEHIAWDGRNPHDMPLLPVKENFAHAIPIPDYVWKDDPYWQVFFGERKTGRANPSRKA